MQEAVGAGGRYQGVGGRRQVGQGTGGRKDKGVQREKEQEVGGTGNRR